MLSSAAQTGRNLGAEDDILDQDTLDGDTPLVCDVPDNLGDLERDGFTLGDDGLHGACADDVSQGGLRSLDEGLAQVGDTECGAVRVADLEVDDGITVYIGEV